MTSHIAPSEDDGKAIPDSFLSSERLQSTR
jgi:hypothetical protein